MSVIIQSKQTALDLSAINSSISTTASNATAESQAVLTALDAHKSAYESKVVEIETAASSLESSLSAQVFKQAADKAEVVALIDAEKLRVDDAVAAVESQAAADKAEVIALVETEKSALQTSIDTLAASSSGVAGGLSSRVDELETKVGADLALTINSALSNGVVQATLDTFLANDEELALKLTDALTERTSADDAIKSKFDFLVAKLFEGLNFQGVTQAELSFGASQVVAPGNPQPSPTNMEIFTNLSTGYQATQLYSFILSTVANTDAGKMVRAHFNIPTGVQIQYEAEDGTGYIPLVDVFGSEAGFSLGDNTFNFTIVADAGDYSMTVEYKEVQTDLVVGGIVLAFTMVEPVDISDFTNLIPDVKPSGEVLIDGANGTYEFEFTTGTDMSYDMFALSNSFAAGEEAVLKIEKADGTVLNLSNVIAFEGDYLSVVNDELKFKNGLNGEKVGVITLEAQTVYKIVSSSSYNDVSQSQNGIDIGIKLMSASGVLPLTYLTHVPSTGNQ